jgi:hypothetical protein
MSEEATSKPEESPAATTETKDESPSSLTEEELKSVEEVKGRLKFFFSDANVRQDVFIRKLLLKDVGDSPHRVAIESLLRFNTIKSHTTNPAVLVQATKELSDILTLDDDEAAIGRVVQFTEEMMNGNIPKSLHIQNVPLKESEDEKAPTQYAVTMDEVRDQFTQYGEVALVKLKWSSNAEGNDDRRKFSKKKFPVGAALVEFETEESLQKAADATLTVKDGEKLEPKDKIALGGTDLEIMKLAEFIDKRKKEKEERAGKPGAENGDSKKRGLDEVSEDTTKFTFDWKPGCVIKLKGLSTACDREALLEMLAAALDISIEDVKGKKIYADFSRGQVEGAIRFPEVSDAIAGIAKRLKEGDLKVKDEKLEDAFVLEGDDEKKYWEDFIAFKNRQIAQNREEKRSKKFRSSRGRGGGRRH